MTTKLSSALPKAEEANGLGAIGDALVGDPTELHVAVVVLDCAKVTIDTDSGDSVPTARVRRIEIIDAAEDKTRLHHLAQRAYEKRTGKAVLPLELEDELRQAFDTGDHGDLP